MNRNAFAAEYGFTAGTAVNVVTRGGTNTFHGSGYLFYRSQKTAARDPLNTTDEKAFEQRISPGFTFESHSSESEHFFTSFEALKYDVARLRSYTSNHHCWDPPGHSRRICKLSNPAPTRPIRPAALPRNCKPLTTQNTRRRCGFYRE